MRYGVIGAVLWGILGAVLGSGGKLQVITMPLGAFLGAVAGYWFVEGDRRRRP